jgi:DNA polymerase-4
MLYHKGMTARKIIHLDLDAFFCAVEELRNPELAGKPFAVGGQPGERGVVSSCSYAARQYGVRSAMPTGRALQLCPPLQLVNSSHHLYGEYSSRVMAVLNDLTPLVEQVSIDEAFMDVSDLPQTGLALAQGLQARIRSEVKLPCSLGVASNKLVAKVATDVAKSRHRAPTPPCAILVVADGEEAAFLSPLPAQAIWGIGPKTAEKLAGMGIHTVGDLTRLSESMLTAQFGRMGLDLYRRARGIDDSPVVTEHEVKSISQEVTFSRDVSDGLALRRSLRNMAEQVAYRLRGDGLAACTVRIKLRWPDFSTHTRQMSLPEPADQDTIIYTCALELFNRLWQPGRHVRLLGVGASGLSTHAHQLSLWEIPSEKESRLLEAIDALKAEYGSKIIRRAVSLKKPANNEDR